MGICFGIFLSYVICFMGRRLSMVASYEMRR